MENPIIGKSIYCADALTRRGLAGEDATPVDFGCDTALGNGPFLREGLGADRGAFAEPGSVLRARFHARVSWTPF